MEGITREMPAATTGTGAGFGRRILILDSDLYRSVGGGQSAYQRLIALHPNDTFYYFQRRELRDCPRPANAMAIPMVPSYQRAADELPRRIGHFFWSYLECRNMAAAVVRHLGPTDFDIVDTPDYNQLGIFIRSALAAEGCRVGLVALALHGTLSSAWRMGWPTGLNDAPVLAALRSRERLQYRSADVRYALSASYASQWERQAGLPVNTIDPLLMIPDAEPRQPPPSDAAPDLAFIGRREKWKGPDLFIDLAWWIDPAAYARLLLIGPDGLNRVGAGSDDILAGMARQRGLAVSIPGGRPQTELHALFSDRTLVLLPSRQDTFNLTALEAVSRGCPVIVSDRAGVAPWLRHRFPKLDWLVTDIDCSRAAAAQASCVLYAYDDRRAQLLDALQEAPLTADPDTLTGMYQPASRSDLEARQLAVDLAAQFDLLVRLESGSLLKSTAHRTAVALTAMGHRFGARMPVRIRQGAARLSGLARMARQIRHRQAFAWDTKRVIEDKVRQVTGFSPRTLAQINVVRSIDAQRLQMMHTPERSPREAEAKIKLLSGQVSDHLVDRVRLFRELARLERKLGHDLVAATYALRVMRWIGDDTHGDLPFVISTLRANGFSREADVAEAMFGPRHERFARCLDLMEEAYHRHRSKPVLPLAILDDRRGSTLPRVSAIVSLYNAASKLPTLLASLNQQSLTQRGELEVVLIDSNSPTDEFRAFEQFVSSHAIPVVYARSAERETIQAAWNRGIKLARAPYLTFLGVDEGVHPDGLRQLADALDSNPSVDWAMADSLVTDVDRSGVYASDIMPYDRRGFHQDLTYLETCYLSWVGGLYRRSIHDRFGYYDESFRAAGDTEFKNRILPHIRAMHVPKLLGVFNNYPEERTTQHPRAEIEDLRAWYLWRTVAGMHYAFGKRSADDAAQLFRDALNYRKSFCGHLSTDFDLASALADHLAERPDGPDWAAEAKLEMGRAHRLIRTVDLVPMTMRSGPSGVASAGWLYKQLRTVQGLAARHLVTFGLPGMPHYELFNDNRYEQHWYSWS